MDQVSSHKSENYDWQFKNWGAGLVEWESQSNLEWEYDRVRLEKLEVLNWLLLRARLDEWRVGSASREAQLAQEAGLTVWGSRNAGPVGDIDLLSV